ncbi:MAG: late competence development ComFB family protein [Deferrisomatales bacterium]|nr:late competence development ComFB family protein [Deferrisomatales bacterium]
MGIRALVKKALEKGFLDLSVELDLEQRLDKAALEAEEYDALVALEHAIQKGQVHTVGRRACVNAMEQLVWAEIVRRVEAGDLAPTGEADLGEIAAHALSRLPARYATTDEGLALQIEEIRQTLAEEIRRSVADSAAECAPSHLYYPERRPLQPTAGSFSVRGLLRKWQANVGGM